MSRKHNIIAPTKCSVCVIKFYKKKNDFFKINPFFCVFKEMKKKNITAFSKHVGKAYHISQRYKVRFIFKVFTYN